MIGIIIINNIKLDSRQLPTVRNIIYFMNFLYKNISRDCLVEIFIIIHSVSETHCTKDSLIDILYV